METTVEHRSDSVHHSTVRRTNGRTLRKSCDRCHQQKLRCVGDKVSLNRCMRCQSAGLECVYSPRSSTQPNKTRNFTWDKRRTEPVTSGTNVLSEFETVFEPELLHIDDIFLSLGSSWDSGDTASIPTYALPPSQSACTSVGSVGTAGSPSSSLTEAAVAPTDGQHELSGRLDSACQVLEDTFGKVIRDHTNQDTQSYPIGEVFSAFEALLRVLELDDMVAISTSQTPQTVVNEYLRIKQASMAVQCYILCLKLMVVLSEQMLQSLLASPLPAQLSAFASFSTPEATQNTNALGGTQEGILANASRVPDNLRLRDLHVSQTDQFGNALDSTINVLQIGSRLLGRIELLLGIPLELGGGDMSSVPSSEQVGHDQHLGPSLPARFVASIWEEEASINKSTTTYFRRCRAAIIGLKTHHS